jgi:hypothetical protein
MSSPPVAVPAGRVITGLVQVACLAAVAVVVAAAPWLSRPWRRAAWLALLLAAAALLLAAAALPMQLILALVAGVTVGAAVLVAFGVPDRRIGPAGIAAALRAGGCSSRPWARTSATPTCCTGRTGRCGCGTSATPGPPRRSCTRSSIRP